MPKNFQFNIQKIEFKSLMITVVFPVLLQIYEKTMKEMTKTNHQNQKDWENNQHSPQDFIRSDFISKESRESNESTQLWSNQRYLL
jgi:hypothetical protein